ncbi:MAG: hypothetical protein IT318_07870 [Anaerolineales bacterium]|nr:hypothetical protein [Anaerolineales bacterium]
MSWQGWYTPTLTAADFYSNSASYHGGRAYAGYAGNYATSLLRGMFVSNTTNGDGRLCSDSDLALDDTQFLRNIARSGNGGGAYAVRNATATRTYFAHNTVITGGNSGGLDTAGSVTISASGFFNNRTLTGSGGPGAEVNANLANVQYISNSAQVHGGAILAYGTARLTDTQVLSNATASHGGGLATNSAVVASSQLENNRGSYSGGVYGAAAAQITETVFISNAATGHGGGLFASGLCAVDGGRFERNRATGPGQGGAIYCNAPTLTISGTQILSNSAGSEGGVRALTNTLANRTLLYNTSGSAMGAPQCYGPLLISGSAFQQNQSAGNGAGLSCASTVQIEGSQFISNTAGGDSALGGGEVAAIQALTATHSTFAGNPAANSGGGALATYQRVYLDHATFTGNTVAAGDGGAVYALNGALVDHASFTDNQSGRNGGALAIRGTLTLGSRRWWATTPATAAACRPPRAAVSPTRCSRSTARWGQASRSTWRPPRRSRCASQQWPHPA